MKRENKLLYFIAGACTYAFSPCLDSISNMIQSKINAIITKWQLALDKEVKAAKEQGCGQEECNCNAIGFAIPAEEEMIEEEYEEE